MRGRRRLGTEADGDDKHGHAGGWIEWRAAMVLAECPHVRGLPSEGTTAQLRRWVQPGGAAGRRSSVRGGCDRPGGRRRSAPAIFLTALGTDRPAY